jgi:phage terminase large subunit GpA-like protein
MDAISDPAVETVVVMKSAQVGWTEILNNVVGYHAHQDPAPILVVQPTLEMGEAWSKDRLTPMLRDSPALRGRISDGKSRDGANTLRHKSFPGGHITIAGANSAASLASRPVRVLLYDEVDRYPASAGTEGDPITLGRKRTSTFWNRKVLMGSTPTIAGVSRIEKAFAESDRRRFWVPCPHCRHAQVLRWAQVKWSEGRPEKAQYHCEECGAGWTDAERWQSIRSAASNGGGWRAEGEFQGVAGFHISELYSSWRRLSETAADFLSAKGRPEMLKAWVNTALGETWQENGDAPDWERLLERREPFPMGMVPPAVRVLTASVDNQAAPERLEFSLWGWAPGYESWLIETKVIPGNPASAEPWDEVKRLVDTDWPSEGGGTMRVLKWAADTGGQHTAGVYAQLRRLRDPRCVPVKGVPGWNKASPVMGPTPVDVTDRGVKIKRGLRLWTVAVDVFKAELYRRLWLGRGEAEAYPAGWVHLPDGLDPEQVKQLVAEQLVTVNDRRGFARQEWRKTRANEQLDLAVYARAALSVLGSDRYGDRFWTRFASSAAEAPAPAEPDDPKPTALAPVVLPQSVAPMVNVVGKTQTGRSRRMA